jgi:uncharacterized membrane protein
MLRKIICLAAALALLMPCISALEITELNYEFHFVGYSVFVEEKIIFGGSVTGAFSLSVPKDAEGISVYIDEKPAEYSPVLRLNSAKTVRINYVTQSVVDKGNFLASIPVKHNISIMSVMLVLEEGTSIMREKSDGISSASVFPIPDEITSDGQSIILNWEMNDVEKGEDMPIYVRIKREKSRWSYIAIVAVLLVLAWAALKKQGGPKKAKEEKQEEEPEKPEKIEIPDEIEKEPAFIKNLKEDEQQVVRVLLLKEGKCEQGTLRVATDFSKAKLSRLLSELEARNIVYKEKRGKKNLIFLK